MNKRVLLSLIAAAFLFASCSKNDPVTPPDLYAEFKADATPRWENGTAVEKNEGSQYTFVLDKGGNLFSSANYKVGRSWSGGDNYEIIEFSGTPAVGKPSGAFIRKPGGTSAPFLLEIVKIEGGKLWIVFKETQTSNERRIVQ